MTQRSEQELRKSRARKAAVWAVEALEPRAYLTGTPPTAAVDASQAAGSEQASIYDFTVTYTDNNQIDASTLGNANLVVTFPNDTSQAATLVSQNLGNAASVQADYQIAFPAELTPADDGPYQVSINANSVKDVAGNAVVAGNIGTFNLVASPTQPPPGGSSTAPTGDFAMGSPSGALLKTSALTGSVQRGTISADVDNTSSNTLTGTVVVTLYTSATPIHDSSSTAVSTFTLKVKNLKSGKGFFAHFAKPFDYPATPGTDYLVTEAALNGAIDSYDGATAVTLVQAFVDADAISAAPVAFKAKLDKRISAYFTIQNVGNFQANAAATVSVAAIPVASGSTIPLATALPLHLILNPSVKRRYVFSFLPTTAPVVGVAYQLILTISLVGDDNAANNAVTSVATMTFS
jgi:hypothetical protein